MKHIPYYMIVDDDSTSNLICEYTIQRFQEKAKIMVYTEPDQALEFLKTIDHHEETIMLLDVNMPKMSGFEFLEEFEKLPREVKARYSIFMLTSSIEDYSSKKDRFPMVRGFLSKPMHTSHLKKIETSRITD